ncbi:conserved hypothetical protein [Xanthobacter versatilis]|uniref:IrrE N-terminal-like domain-containing protein n=1 Tax=Xanthobacter autotrophicus (strain ATCC BAA-1158 / Py2) TaxID=78245 RepID=A7IHK1_XANP2|nr:conserved hypothetical protein [Xanthobacter autotrophicus Py2]
MDDHAKALMKELLDAGLSEQAIKAAWPTWWSDAAATSSSARAELRFVLSRHLGLSPKSLLGERVEFVWSDEARFKNLTTHDQISRSALASFGVAVGRLLLRATPNRRPLDGLTASQLRTAILGSRSFVDLVGLLSACWALGVPVIHLRVFPLHAKSMRAMVVNAGARHAILLGRDASYPAPIAFTLAHEMGHAALGHAASGQTVVDEGDPVYGSDDKEEQEADAYGLELLTGSAQPEITLSTDRPSMRSLAQQCLEQGPANGIEPGTLALCVGHLNGDWKTANAALRHIYTDARPVWSEVNKVAAKELDWEALSPDSVSYLHALLGQNV